MLKIIKLKMKYKVRKKGNLLYCRKCKKWFFSSKYAKYGTYPSQCNLCKQPEWMKPRKRKK